MECRHADTAGGTDTDDSLQTDRRSESLAEFSCKLDSIFSARCVEAWVEVCLTCRVPWKARQCSDISVCGGEEPHVDGDLGLGALDGECLVEAGCRSEQSAFLGRSKELGVVTSLESASTKSRQTRAESNNLASDLADELVCSLEGGAKGVADDVRVLEHVAELAEQVLDRWTRLGKVDKEVDWLGQEDISQVGNNEHCWLSVLASWQ